MKIASNVPVEPILSINGIPSFRKGDRVRIQTKSRKYPQYPYADGGYIGQILQIGNKSLSLYVEGITSRTIFFEDIFLMRRVSEEETFENTPYYDEAERQFWEDYWWTAEGIARKTDEDKRKLKEFRRQFEEGR